ncbi:MAG: 2Fe-2S iron-sulfur cluster-binding protein [Oligoflexia bacterium]|nr:2Fe-2S iron-sulfur cluster-binding protein [Oligoflexia bacterium]
MTFMPLKRHCWFSGMPSILEVAIANDIPLNHSCGGMGSCTTCRVFIEKGLEKLAPPNGVEKEHIIMRDWKPDERLGCQATAEDGLVVVIPSFNSDGI